LTNWAKLQTDTNGRPPYHPAQLLKLYLYGYLNKVRSSRDLEKNACAIPKSCGSLCKLAPDHNTIASFRKNNTKGIQRVFQATVKIALHFELIGGTTSW
jgi:transposase